MTYSEEMKKDNGKMGRSQSNIIYHDFYCTNCAGRITLPRNKGFLRGQGHLKKYSCPFCKQVVNFFEIYNYEDIEYFHKAFSNGNFKEMVQESIDNNLVPTGLTK